MFLFLFLSSKGNSPVVICVADGFRETKKRKGATFDYITEHMLG